MLEGAVDAGRKCIGRIFGRRGRREKRLKRQEEQIMLKRLSGRRASQLNTTRKSEDEVAENKKLYDGGCDELLDF